MAHDVLGYVGYGWLVVLVAAVYRELISFYFFLFTLLLVQWLFFPPPALTGEIAVALGLAAAWNEAAQLEARTGQVSGGTVALSYASGQVRQAAWGGAIGLAAGAGLCYAGACRPAVPVAGAFLCAFLFDLFKYLDWRRSLGAAIVVLECENAGLALKLLTGVVILVSILGRL